MLLYETLGHEGQPRQLFLESSEGGLTLHSSDGLRAAVPARVIIAVLRRYGRPVDENVDTRGEELALTDVATLRRFRFRAGVDAIGRDYLGLFESGQDPIVALATTVAGALEHLAAA